MSEVTLATVNTDLHLRGRGHRVILKVLPVLLMLVLLMLVLLVVEVYSVCSFVRIGC